MTLKEKELCWEIEEQRPIPIQFFKTFNNKHRICIKPMLISYETFELVISDHNLENIQVGSFATYDYSDGSCEITCNTEDDLQKWLIKYEGVFTWDQNIIKL